MRPPLTIDREMTVDEIMRRWPTTIRVFIRNQMLCIGCPIGVFHTVHDACNAHDLDEKSISRELLAAMANDAFVAGSSAFEAAGSYGQLPGRRGAPLNSAETIQTGPVDC